MHLAGRTPGDRARFDAGPTEAHGVCTLCGRDVQRIIAGEFDIKYTLTHPYEILHKLGYSCLAPRPKHERHDPEAAGISALRG
jgi:transposase